MNCRGMTLSLDGFISDRTGSVGELYPHFEELRDSEMMQAMMNATGAVVMGRTTYEMGNGDYTGYELQAPIFVVTHAIPETAAKGQNDRLSFTFVTEGVEAAIAQAKVAAGDKDVMIVGGADVTQQALNAGLVDELQVGIMPVLFGEGVRFFENLTHPPALEKINLMESVGGRTDIFYRVLN
jgi:dihydrofolate reductase